MPSQTDLAALLCSRLCHDMLSPVGALSNGLELLADEHDLEMRERCIELLEQSARISTGKLKFFRLAFGAAGGFGESVPIEETMDVIDAIAPDGGKVAINWALNPGGLPKPATKVLLNLAQIALDTLVRGGTLDIGAEARGGNIEIALRASGDKIAFDEETGKALQGELRSDAITSRNAAAHMIALLAQEMGGKLQYARTNEALVLGAVLPQPDGLIG